MLVTSLFWRRHAVHASTPCCSISRCAGGTIARVSLWAYSVARWYVDTTHMDLRKGSCDVTREVGSVRAVWLFFPSALALWHANGLVEALVASVWPSELPVLETYSKWSAMHA